MSVKFIHTSGLYLGTKFSNKKDRCAWLNSDVRDSINGFNKVIALGIREKIDFLLICGDIFNKVNPTCTEQREFIRLLMSLVEKDIPVIMIGGKTDIHKSFGEAGILEVIREFNIPKIKVIVHNTQIVKLDLGEKGHIQIVCFPYLFRNNLLDEEDLKKLSEKEIAGKINDIQLSLLKRSLQELSPGIPAVFAGYVNEESPINKDIVTLLDGNVLYAALGGLTKNSLLCESPPIVYSGSITRQDFNEEKEEKGFYIVNLDDKEISHRFKKIYSRPMVTIDIDVREKEEPEEIIINAIEEHNLEEAIVRINIHASKNFELFNSVRIKKSLESAYYVHSIKVIT